MKTCNCQYHLTQRIAARNREYAYNNRTIRRLEKERDALRGRLTSLALEIERPDIHRTEYTPPDATNIHKIKRLRDALSRVRHANTSQSKNIYNLHRIVDKQNAQIHKLKDKLDAPVHNCYNCMHANKCPSAYPCSDCGSTLNDWTHK